MANKKVEDRSRGWQLPPESQAFLDSLGEAEVVYPREKVVVPEEVEVAPGHEVDVIDPSSGTLVPGLLRPWVMYDSTHYDPRGILPGFVIEIHEDPTNPDEITVVPLSGGVTNGQARTLGDHRLIHLVQPFTTLPAPDGLMDVTYPPFPDT
ncbi:hypothetical protein HYW35_02345 [Candidatus Saccharibacteria bacterium]|nr:hypothetical protein [Candidatus Saccharibacteria bacterium]